MTDFYDIETFSQWLHRSIGEFLPDCTASHARKLVVIVDFCVCSRAHQYILVFNNLFFLVFNYKSLIVILWHHAKK
jgi:hypothetical protein